jgi:hypothetical protein
MEGWIMTRDSVHAPSRAALLDRVEARLLNCCEPAFVAGWRSGGRRPPLTTFYLGAVAACVSLRAAAVQSDRLEHLTYVAISCLEGLSMHGLPAIQGQSLSYIYGRPEVLRHLRPMVLIHDHWTMAEIQERMDCLLFTIDDDVFELARGMARLLHLSLVALVILAEAEVV